MRQLLFFLIIILSNHFIFANNYSIKLKSSLLNADNKQNIYSINMDSHYLMTFSSIPSTEEKKELESIGINFLEYIPNNTYVIFSSKNLIYNDFIDYNIYSITKILPSFKIDPKISDRSFPEWAFFNNKLYVKILIYKNINLQIIEESLLSVQSFTIQNIDYLNNNIIGSLDPGDLNLLASLNYVWYIEPIDPPSYPENKTAISLHRSNIINVNYANGKKYNGEGINVMMQDDGFVGPHIDRQGRLDQSNCSGCSSSANDDHGDHVSGTIMGAGNLDPKAKGMADGAFLYVYGSSNNNYNDVPSLYQNNDVVITSKSYSNGCNAGYTSLAQDLDEQINSHPSLVHVFSAGNDGSSDCGYGAGSGWGNVTGGHKQGKNVIATANLSQTSILASSSSRGPAADGRIKPDIGAKGTNVYSTEYDNTYGTKTGTSMSCPGISGVMAQLYHAYKNLNQNQNPNSALMKCVLLNSANDIGNPGPDFKNGWGEVNAYQALNVLEDNNYFSNTISQGSINTHDINVPSGVREMNVMIYWHDKEASANALIALVNNLNMSLSDPSSNVLYPWLLDPTPNANILNQNALTGVDDLNNMEQITVINPNPGTYTLTIDGFSIPFGPQEYWISYQFITDEITLTYPIGGEGLVPGEMELIRWDACAGNSPFTLEYTVDGGNTWSSISNSVSVSANYFNWQVPNIVTDQARIRISRNGILDESDADFTIVKVPNNLNVNWICPDSIYVSWNNVNGATSYEVSMLGQKYMDSITTVSGNAAWVINPNPGVVDSWFSVRSVVNGLKGRRAVAVNAQSINNGCIAPPIAMFNILNSPSCSGEIIFEDQSYNQPNNWQWDFGDGNFSNQQNPTHTYSQEGTYNVKLYVSNALGQDSVLQTNIVEIDFPPAPIGFNDTSYVNPAIFNLFSNENVNWYDDTLSNIPIYNGSNFQTPLLNTNTSYYIRKVGGPSVYGGPLDNSIGSGGLYNNDRHLYLDCYVACNLVSADIYAGTNQAITFELRNNNSQVIDDTTITVQVGLNTLYLNFNLPVMNNLELGISASGADLYRNSSGASYPYNIGTLASITGHNSPWGDPEYHYFFYNLQLQENCISEFAEVNAIFINSTSIDDFNSNLSIFPNPTSNILNISSDKYIDRVKIYDMSGTLILNLECNSKYENIDLSILSKGFYSIQISSEKFNIKRKLVIK
tara:strand:+ start:71409 stop:74969 length:3561 start_codon:yes stop_codon:yes gene_type:complete